MKLTTISRTIAALGAATVLSAGLASCGSSDDSASSDTSTTQEESSSSSDADETFGPACDQIPDSGDGSLKGMADEPVATAAGANPLLKTLVTAVKKADLVDTLNSADEATVFAPTDDAFDDIPSDDLDAVLDDKGQLTSVLTHHVVGERLSPSELAGTQKTLNDDSITVSGSGDDYAVELPDGGEAKVLCGNIQTANATVYVIDSVLMP